MGYGKVSGWFSIEELILNVHDLPREELPEMLGAVVELEARIRMRLSEPPREVAADQFIDAERAAEIAGTSKRWILAKTMGMKFRHDLSRKQPRFKEAGLRAWIERRR